MKQPDLSLYEAIDPFLKRNGFDFIKSRGVFIRKQDYGFDEFMWYIHPVGKKLPKWLGGHYGGDYGIGQRHNDVAEIMEILDLISGTTNKKYASTIHRAVTGQYFPFNKTRDVEMRLPFNNLEKSTTETAKRIEEMFETDGFNWFKKYSNLALLSKEINNPITIRGAAGHPLVNHPDNRALIGVAITCIFEPDNVNNLIESYVNEALKYDKNNVGKAKPITSLFEERFKKIVERAKELDYL